MGKETECMLKNQGTGKGARINTYKPGNQGTGKETEINAYKPGDW